jgi:hypothetical protein
MAYEINININNVGGEEVEEQSGVSSKATNTEQQKAVKAMGKYVASQTIQPFIQTVKSNVSQNIQTVTGNSDLQRRVNFGMETIQYGLNAFSNAQAGIGVVTALGGTATGGVVLGLALTAIQTGIEVINNSIQIELQERMENYQLQQIRERSGAMFNRSRRN